MMQDNNERFPVKIYFTEEMFERLKQIAQIDDRSMASIVRRATLTWLDEHLKRTGQHLSSAARTPPRLGRRVSQKPKKTA